MIRKDHLLFRFFVLFNLLIVATNSLTVQNNNQVYDVVIVGGSSSGLSAALTLARSLRRVIVVDNANPCNQQQPKSFNLLTHDGRPPQEIAALALQDVSRYDTVDFSSGLVTAVTQTNNNDFQIQTTAPSNESSIQTRKVIFATGVRDLLPMDIPGLQECWGSSVIHCPYCHGYEYRGRPTALWMNANNLMKMAPVVRTLTSDLYVLGSGIGFEPEQLNFLQKHNIPIIQEKVEKVQHRQGLVESVVFENGSTQNLDAIYIRPDFEHQLPQLLFQSNDISLDFNDNGYINVDDNQKTNIDGIMACGDCTTPNRSLSIAIASGTRAAKMLNYELSIEDWEST